MMRTLAATASMNFATCCRAAGHFSMRDGERKSIDLPLSTR